MTSPAPFPLRIGRWESDDDEQGTDQLPAVDAAPAQEKAPGNLLMLRGGQMSAGGQAKEAMAHAFRVARLRAEELRKREGGIVHGLMRAKPPSVQEQCDYAHSRAWVPPGHDGGLAEKSGVIYHAVIGRPGVAFGNWISATAARPLRFFLTVLILSVLSICLFAFVL